MWDHRTCWLDKSPIHPFCYTILLRWILHRQFMYDSFLLGATIVRSQSSYRLAGVAGCHSFKLFEFIKHFWHFLCFINTPHNTEFRHRKTWRNILLHQSIQYALDHIRHCMCTICSFRVDLISPTAGNGFRSIFAAKHPSQNDSCNFVSNIVFVFRVCRYFILLAFLCRFLFTPIALAFIYRVFK